MAGVYGYPMPGPGKMGSSRKRGGMNTGMDAILAGDKSYGAVTSACRACYMRDRATSDRGARSIVSQHSSYRGAGGMKMQSHRGNPSY